MGWDKISKRTLGICLAERVVPPFLFSEKKYQKKHVPPFFRSGFTHHATIFKLDTGPPSGLDFEKDLCYNFIVHIITYFIYVCL